MNTLRKFAVGAVIGTSIFGVILCMLLLAAHYQSWTPVYWAAFYTIVLPIAVFLCAEHGSGRDGAFKKFLSFLVRLYWKHIVLAACMWAAAVIAVMVIFSTFESAAKRATRTETPVFFRKGRLPQSETERFFGFANSVTAPVQFLCGGLVLLWQVFVLLAVLFFEQVSKWIAAHAVFSATLTAALYAWWLVVTVRKLWREEFPAITCTAPAGSGTASPAMTSTGYWLK